MRLQDVSVPEVYKESQDFRFFLKWFELCLSQIHYDIENMQDIYDPLRCKTDLLWMLADTMGFQYDERQYPAFNRLVLLYFMDMIRNRGSKDGMLTAGQVNLASKTILEKFSLVPDEQDPSKWDEVWEELEDSIYQDRLYSDVLPANSVSVYSNPEQGYIDVIYFADSLPDFDTCIEYVRPIGMYCSQTPGVRYDAKTRISIDSRLVDTAMNAFGRTMVANYYTNGNDVDYGNLQDYNNGTKVARNRAYKSNSNYEGTATVDAGYRTLYSLQVSNTPQAIRSALSGNNQGRNLRGINWVDTGVSLNQIADEFNWNLPEPENTNEEISEENTEITSETNNTNMGSLGDTLS